MVLLLQYTLIFASVLILVALGGCFAEHSGVINLGLEGIMLVGAYAGFAVTMATGNPWLGIAASFAAGCAITLIHAFLCMDREYWLQS